MAGASHEDGLAGRHAAGATPGSRIAAVVLIALAVLSPWAFGSVDPWATRLVTLAALAAALVALLRDARAGALRPAPLPRWPLAGLWLLALAQLVPLPEALHHAVAPGSATVWHPQAAAAATVLGPGPRPISLHPEATRRTLAFATGLLALALAAAPALRVRRLLLRAAVALVAGAVAVALYAVVARLAFGDRIYGLWAVPTVAPFGPFVSKNHFAGYVELGALLALGLAAGLASEARRGADALSWIESRRARYVVLAWGAAAVLILAVPASQSRGGVVSLAAGLVAFAALRLLARRGARLSPRGLIASAIVAALLLAALVAVLPAEARARVLTLAGITTDQSGSYRLAVWRDTLRLAGSSPWLGSGLGAFEDALPRFKSAAGQLAVEHAESDWLELAAEGGLIGAALVAAFAALVLARGLRAAQGASHGVACGLACGALAGLVALAVHSAFDFNLRIPSNALLATALLALLLAAAAVPEDVRAVQARPTVAAAVPVSIVALTLAVALATPWTSRRIEAGSLVRSSRAAAPSLRRAGLEADVISHLRRRPADATAWLALAWLRLASAPGDAPTLAGWAVGLDPKGETVSEAGRRISRAAP